MTSVRPLTDCNFHDCSRTPTAVYAGFALENDTALYCYHPVYCGTHAAQLGDADPQKVRVATISAEAE